MKISIITPVFNSAKTIKDCLESVKSQSYFDVEHIIVDGVSSDDSLSIARKYAPNSRILSEKDNGIYDAINKGIKMASGDIIGVLHSDDVYAYNNVLRDVANTFDREKTDSCYGDLCYVRSSDISSVIRYWKSGLYQRKAFKYGWMPPHPTFFVRKEVYLKYGFFDLSYNISSDYELMIRFLFVNNVSTSYLPKVLINMRLGGKSNKGLKNLFLKMKEDYRIVRKYELGGFKTLFLKNIRKVPQFF